MLRRGKALAAVIFCFFSASPASALTTSEFAEADNGFQTGYVFGIMEYMVSAVNPNDKADLKRATAYLNCFKENKINSAEALKIVQRYIDRTPDASATPMVGNVLRAYRQTCERYFKD